MKFSKYIICAVILAVLIMPLVTAKASASDVPSFPSCVNPQGTVISQFNSGTHGIVGDMSTHAGSDSVFQVGSTQVLQCFCPSSGGTGVQTNFLNAKGFSNNQISSLIAQGWIFIPDGSVWGLTSDAFLAKNQDFSCASQFGGIGGGEVLGSSSSSSSSTSPVQGVLGAMSLAGTGNLQFIFAVFCFSFLLTLIGTVLHKFKK